MTKKRTSEPAAEDGREGTAHNARYGLAGTASILNAAQSSWAAQLQRSPRLSALHRQISAAFGPNAPQASAERSKTYRCGAPVTLGMGTVQRQTTVKYQPQTIRFGNNDSESIGGTMQADLDPNDPIRGTSTDSHEIPGIMGFLSTHYSAGNAGWHRGHLLNAKLGGLNIPSNLAPFTKSMNTGGHSDMEAMVKRLVGIGIRTHYEVRYYWTADDSSFQPMIDIALEPRPEDDNQRQQIEIRKGQLPSSRQSYTVKGLAYRSDYPERPSSPQQSITTFGEDTDSLARSDKYTGFYDKRLEENGWGELRRTSGEQNKLVSASLSQDERVLIEQRIATNNNTLNSSSTIGGNTYSTDYWTRHTKQLQMIRRNGDVVYLSTENSNKYSEYVTATASDIIITRHGTTKPAQYEPIQLIYTRNNGNQVWHVHDGQINGKSYITITPTRSVVADHGNIIPSQYEYLGIIFTRQNGNRVSEMHDGATNKKIYSTIDEYGTIITDHADNKPPQYEAIEKKFTRYNGHEVWKAFDGIKSVSSYITVDSNRSVVFDHNQTLPERYEKLHTDDSHVWLHDGALNKVVWVAKGTQ